jgi:hypothetical protein
MTLGGIMGSLCSGRLFWFLHTKKGKIGKRSEGNKINKKGGKRREKKETPFPNPFSSPQLPSTLAAYSKHGYIVNKEHLG